MDSVMIRERREENWVTLSAWEVLLDSMELREVRTSASAEVDMFGGGDGDVWLSWLYFYRLVTPEKGEFEVAGI